MTKVFMKNASFIEVRALRTDLAEQLVLGDVGRVFNVNADGTVDVDWGAGELGFGYTKDDVEVIGNEK